MPSKCKQKLGRDDSGDSRPEVITVPEWTPAGAYDFVPEF